MTPEDEEFARIDAEIKRRQGDTSQPVPVKTYRDGKPWPVAPVPNGPYSAPIKELWPVAPKPWVNLTDEDVKEIREQCDSIVTLHAIKAIEAKLREKNT
jgi:hypothetical protein